MLPKVVCTYKNFYYSETSSCRELFCSKLNCIEMSIYEFSL